MINPERGLNLAICDRMPNFCSEVGEDGLLMLTRHGSHLYGTDTPASDVDIKGIFMPSAKQILLGKIPKTYSYQSKKNQDEKNSAGDIDIEIFSLHYFIEMACKGETISIDLLHVREHQALLWTSTWQRVFDIRADFYTKDMRAFVGYARTQAAKYGIKGSRLDAVKKVVDFLESIQFETEKESLSKKLKSVWNDLPSGEHIHKLDPNPRDKNNNEIYQVCGKQFLENTSLYQMHRCLKEFYTEYGARARLAQENKGVDWKAVSHAFRAAFQLREIYEKGDLEFPLTDCEYLKTIKSGGRDWSFVQMELESAIAIVEQLAEESKLPANPNRNNIDKFLFDIVKSFIQKI